MLLRCPLSRHLLAPGAHTEGTAGAEHSPSAWSLAASRHRDDCLNSTPDVLWQMVRARLPGRRGPLAATPKAEEAAVWATMSPTPQEPWGGDSWQQAGIWQHISRAILRARVRAPEVTSQHISGNDNHAWNCSCCAERLWQ